MPALPPKPKLNPQDGRVYLGDVALTRSEEDYLKHGRHFTPEGTGYIRDVMASIGMGDNAARDSFLTVIRPFVERSATRTAIKVYGDQVDMERVKEITQDVLLDVMQKPEYFQGLNRSWSNFSQRIQTDFNHKFSADKEKLDQEQNTKLLADVAIASGQGDPQNTLAARQLKADMETAIDSQLGPRAAKVLKVRYGIGTGEDRDLESVANMYDVTRERIRHIEGEAIKRIRQSPAAHDLSGHLDTGIPSLLGKRKPQVASQEYWQSQVNNAQEYRAALRAVFTEAAGKEYTDKSLRSALNLNETQWHALMKADLAHNLQSCGVLHNQEHEITRKLNSALLKALSENPQAKEDEARDRLSEAVAGIMRIARDERTISR